MRLSEMEKKALRSAVQWMRKLKEETLMPNARHAYETKKAKIRKESMEDALGLSSGQVDQKWINKANALKQKISYTRVHQHKTPP